MIDVVGWHAYVDNFMREAYPLLAEHGVTPGEALMLWELNMLNNTLVAVKEALEDRP